MGDRRARAVMATGAELEADLDHPVRLWLHDRGESALSVDEAEILVAELRASITGAKATLRSRGGVQRLPYRDD